MNAQKVERKVFEPVWTGPERRVRVNTVEVVPVRETASLAGGADKTGFKTRQKERALKPVDVIERTEEFSGCLAHPEKQG